jgi:hypothetical protein
MPLARSFLYVPANREKFLEKAIGLPSDAFIFDLEDSVPPAEKANARAGVRAYAGKISDNRVWVRVNGLDTGLAEADLDAVIGVAGLAGLFLPKVETREEVARWDAMVGTLEHARGVDTGTLKLVLSIESALGVLNAHVMATAAARVVSLTFGGAQDGDLNTDLGCAWSIDGPEMLHARAHTRSWPRARRALTPRSTGCSPMCGMPRASSATPRSRAGSAIAGASSFIPRRSSRATGSTAQARRSWTIMRACWRHSTRRWRKAAPRPPSTAV